MQAPVPPSRCTGCWACAQICPTSCIEMIPDGEGFLCPVPDDSACIDCDRCKAVCPVLHGPSPGEGQTRAVAAHALDREIQGSSSSGGVFTHLAQGVIARGGIVFGAAFDGPAAVRHIGVETVEGLSRLRSSKYVQSALGDTLGQAQKALGAGRQVLFSGTPCQISGLNRFLGREYEALLSVDIVCHSIPSPWVWRRYLAEVEQEQGVAVVSVNFRDKATGWEGYSLSITLADGRRLLTPGRDHLYMQAFLRGLSARTACFDCPFRGLHRESDLTLADFWGVGQTCPQALDEGGTSLVLLHTDKGQGALSAIAPHLVTTQVPPEEALAHNPAAVQSGSPHPRRGEFFSRLKTESFSPVAADCLRPTARELAAQQKNNSPLHRLARKLKRLF